MHAGLQHGFAGCVLLDLLSSCKRIIGLVSSDDALSTR